MEMKLAILILTLSVSTVANAQCWFNPMKVETGLNTIDVNYNEQKNSLDRKMAKVKSKVELNTYISMSKSGENPLDKLSSTARKRFIESLTFNESGITGYRYADLEEELSPSEIKNILALFGTQNNVALFKNSKSVTKKDTALMAGEESTTCIDWSGGIGGGGGGGGIGGGGGGIGGGGGGIGGGGGGGYAIPVPPQYPPGPSIPQDYMGYYCDAKGSCKVVKDYICLKTC